MRFLAILLPIIAQGALDPTDERFVNFQRLPKIFEWYKTLVSRFVRGKKVQKYTHRINDLHKRIVWEAERCPQAGPVSTF